MYPDVSWFHISPGLALVLVDVGVAYTTGLGTLYPISPGLALVLVDVGVAYTTGLGTLYPPPAQTPHGPGGPSESNSLSHRDAYREWFDMHFCCSQARRGP